MPVYSRDDFHGCLHRAVQRRRARRQWGPWRLDAETFDLSYIRPDDCVSYCIDLLCMSDARAVVETLAQVCGKTWCSASDLGSLVRALDDVFNLRGAFGGAPIDPGRYLRGVYGEPGDREGDQ